MINPKNILVTTTSSLQGTQVKEYLRPISAHIVAGTNVFSDVLASFTDVFGGRSKSYQKQISSLYSDAIEKLKISAYEIGANCILGLHIDLDEISGKGKSMFMITAVGTAVVIDEAETKTITLNDGEKFDIISSEKIKGVQKKNEIILKAQNKSLILDDEIWNFVTINKVSEIFPYIIEEFKPTLLYAKEKPAALESFYKNILTYLDALSYEVKTLLLYKTLVSENDKSLVSKILEIISTLQLFDFANIKNLLDDSNFEIQKLGVHCSTFDKSFYAKEDIRNLTILISLIRTKFPEIGVRSFKKGFLSSKEKEVWTCKCGSDIEIGKICGNCKTDIYGFTAEELNAPFALELLEEKVQLISNYIK